MGLYFNLDEDELAFARTQDVFCLVIYDIISNKRRVKLSRLLEAYGIRVQRSCFEIAVTKSIYKKLIRALQEFYDETERDQISVYKVYNDGQVIFNEYCGAKSEEIQIFL
ncbi:CRISPR-associated endonuclease Cas2 [Streptococcus dentapri]|uniref:CRISPR-associated endoribonuclease Cas2 n=1 Tax=Streptococcus dentapri TaxID=573564 RepID=A0ABV8D0D9_9STRE